MSTDIPRFNDQQKGTVTFVVWKEHLAIYAGELGGETAKQILFGKISGIRVTEGQEKSAAIYNDLGLRYRLQHRQVATVCVQTNVNRSQRMNERQQCPGTLKEQFFRVLEQ